MEKPRKEHADDRQQAENLATGQEKPNEEKNHTAEDTQTPTGQDLHGPDTTEQLHEEAEKSTQNMKKYTDDHNRSKNKKPKAKERTAEDEEESEAEADNDEAKEHADYKNHQPGSSRNK